MIQSMRIRWAGIVACMVENKNVRVLVGEDEGKEDFKDMVVDGTQNPNRSSRNRMDRRGLELNWLGIEISGALLRTT
jgi:hypothetical protein